MQSAVAAKKAGHTGFFCFGTVILAWLLSTALACATPLKLEIAEVRTAHVRASGELLLVIRLSEQAGKVFAQFTDWNVGRKVRIRGGGHVNEPVIREPIRDGSLQMIGFDSSSELERTADAIRRDGFIEIAIVPR